MSRLTITLTAAAASALAAAAIVALPALGDDGKSGGDDVASYAACLRSHGLDGAPSDSPMALKQWLGAKEQTDPATVKKAINACAPAEERRELSSADVAKLVACMRDNGLDAPSDPAALKAWFLRMETDDPDALERVVPDCKTKLDPAAGERAKPGVCADDAGPKPDDPAAKPDEPAKIPEATT